MGSSNHDMQKCLEAHFDYWEIKVLEFTKQNDKVILEVLDYRSL